MKKTSLLFLLIFSLILTGCAQTTKDFTMNIATFNIRMDTDRDSLDAWKHRKEMVKGLVRFHDFDIVGVQEAFKHQIDGILDKYLDA